MGRLIESVLVQTGRMSLLEPLTHGKTVRLDEIDTSQTSGLDKEEATEKLEVLGLELSELQDLLFASGVNGLLVVLQGMDTSGKDGLIRCLLRYMNAQSTRVCPFKVPTPKEASHDFLWRVHAVAPGVGEVAIFNRSHYEDVLVPVVLETVKGGALEKRYDHINNFENLLLDRGIVIVKYFLHISKDEQEERLLDREKEVEKSWKLSVGDWQVREKWSNYQKAYEGLLEQCNQKHAPWMVVPADRKWYRNLAVVESLVEVLRPYKKPWLDSLESRGKTERAALEAYRANQRKG